MEETWPGCRWSFLDRIGYGEANRLQESLRSGVREGGGEMLLLLEHPPVFTLGRSATRDEILWPEDELQRRGVEVVESDRGGQVTFHGPGQLVGWPIIDLNPDRRDVRRYVRDLQHCLVETLAGLGVEAHGRAAPEIGVWVGERKIASIGIHLKRWIPTHGFALNLTTDLGFFAGIVPCGLQGVEMTSVEAENGQRPDTASVASSFAEAFGRHFERRMEAVEAGVVR